MKADPAHQRTLLLLEALDTTMTRLDQEERSLPETETLRGLKADFDVLNREAGVTGGVLEDARADLARIESDVAVVEARVARDTQRLESSSSVKDVRGLEAELESLRRRRSDLEDRELEVMQRVEDAEERLTDLRTRRDDIASRATEVRSRREETLTRLREERERVTRDRERTAGTVPADLLALYTRQRERYGIGAALLRGRVSLGSNVTLTGSDLEAVRRAAPDDVVFCPDSNAILVRTEESDV